MAEPFYLIDGYNLMHAAGMARLRYGPGDLERCRNRFLRYLAARLDEVERGRTTVVFDAHDAPHDASRQSRLEGMLIVFAPSDSDADTHIEELLAAHSAPRQVRVVSGDHRLQKAARKRRGVAVESEAFYRELDRRTPRKLGEVEDESSAASANPKFDGTISERETAEWLKIFGDIPGTADLRPGVDRQDFSLDDLRDDLDDDPRTKRRPKR